MAADLIEAIVDLLSGDAGVAGAVPGGVRAGMLSVGSEMPYGRIDKVAETNAHETAAADGSLRRRAAGEFQVGVFARTRGAAYDGASAVEDALDDAEASLPVDGLTVRGVRSIGRLESVEKADAPGGGDIWQCIIRFEYQLDRSKPDPWG